MPQVRLPLRLRTLVHERGPDEVKPAVRCPQKGRTIDALRCTGCARMREIEWDLEHGGSIECQTDAEVSAASNGDRRADFAELAARRTLDEVMSPVTVCVAAGTSVKRVRALLLGRQLEAVPVVDAEMRLLGVVSRSELLTAPLDARAEEIVPSKIHALPERSPIAYAIALMAFERLVHVPVVTEDGELVGTWDAVSALRWTAERMGYVQ